MKRKSDVLTVGDIETIKNHIINKYGRVSTFVFWDDVERDFFPLTEEEKARILSAISESPAAYVIEDGADKDYFEVHSLKVNNSFLEISESGIVYICGLLETGETFEACDDSTIVTLYDSENPLKKIRDCSPEESFNIWGQVYDENPEELTELLKRDLGAWFERVTR